MSAGRHDRLVVLRLPLRLTLRRCIVNLRRLLLLLRQMALLRLVGDRVGDLLIVLRLLLLNDQHLKPKKQRNAILSIRAHNGMAFWRAESELDGRMEDFASDTQAAEKLTRTDGWRRSRHAHGQRQAPTPMHHACRQQHWQQQQTTSAESTKKAAMPPMMSGRYLRISLRVAMEGVSACGERNKRRTSERED